MNETEWFRKVAEANFPLDYEIYFSEISKGTYRLAMENDKYCIGNDEVKVYEKGSTVILFSPRRDDLEQCTANVLFYEDFDSFPLNEDQVEELVADLGLKPEEEDDMRQFYRGRMNRLKSDYCKPISEYVGEDREIELWESSPERMA